MRLLRAGLFALVYYGGSAAFSLTVGLAVAMLRPSRAMAVARGWSVWMVRAAEIILDMRVVVSGAEHIPSGAALIASQHRSAFDTMIWFKLAPQAAFVMKKELFRIPVYGAIARHAGMVGVDREGGGTAMRAMITGARAAAAAGRQLVIFPEGTRVPAGAQVPPQPGIVALATATGLAVIPVATDSGLVWGKGPFAKRPGVIHVAIGPPIPPGLRREALLARLVQEWRVLEVQAGIADNAAGGAP